MSEDMKKLFEMLNECVKTKNCNLTIDGLSSKVIIDYINNLQQENTRLKQQLKDKDEKISKVRELLEEASLSSLSPFELFKIEKEINEILESNKEEK